MADTHEVDHLIGRLAGEGPAHPRQKIVRWLEDHHGDVGCFNRLYAEATKRHEEKTLYAKESYASYEAFGELHGATGDPNTDELWASIV